MAEPSDFTVILCSSCRWTTLFLGSWSSFGVHWQGDCSAPSALALLLCWKCGIVKIFRKMFGE